jgi:hypothetical protein
VHGTDHNDDATVPVAGLGALALVALLLSVIALLARLRRSKVPSAAA